MGTIAARDCLRIIELCEQVCAATMLATVQGIQLRRQRGELSDDTMTEPVKEFFTQVRAVSEFVNEDRPLEGDLREVIQLIRQKHWSLYECD